MDCSKCLNNILFYLDKELSEVDRLMFDAHLKECPQCNNVFAEVAATYGLIAAENQLETSPFFYHKLKTKLETKEEDKVIKLFSALLKPIAIAASITLGILIGNQELDVLNSDVEDSEIADENFTPVLPADYSVWISMNEEYGSED